VLNACPFHLQKEIQSTFPSKKKYPWITKEEKPYLKKKEKKRKKKNPSIKSTRQMKTQVNITQRKKNQQMINKN
jgi:uncharacterized protein (DUF2249 family)